MQADILCSKIAYALTDDLRRKPYKGNKNTLVGHCYVASEAFFHIMGGSDAGWVPMYIRHEDAPHWFVWNKNTLDIVDITASQFKTLVPYELAIGKGFLTRQPSRRAQILIGRIR